MKEIWKDIEGFEDKYQISNLGNIKSLKDSKGNKREKILKLQKDNKGYLRIQLFKGGKYYTKIVHRLVAIAFIPNPENKPQVNHIKEFEKDNNRVDNLEWCDNKYNCNYGTRSKRGGEKHSKQVYQYSLSGELIKVWQSTLECSRSGFNHRRISDCGNGIRKSYKSFIWSYKTLSKEDVIKIYNSIEKKSKKVYQFDINGNLVKVFSSLKECKDNGYTSANIYKCCVGKRKTHKGYKWSYTLK